ncbi:MAG: hypothetical protein AABN95_25105 [Acidobacteriota bacterium]
MAMQTGPLPTEFLRMGVGPVEVRGSATWKKVVLQLVVVVIGEDDKISLTENAHSSKLVGKQVLLHFGAMDLITEPSAVARDPGGPLSRKVGNASQYLGS